MRKKIQLFKVKMIMTINKMNNQLRLLKMKMMNLTKINQTILIILIIKIKSYMFKIIKTKTNSN